ncbi:dihydrolipoyllysine-residue acetyltransferase component 2 of pyruvate dehydrogenase complex, mitochondrial isoform X2 [Brassica napus]|uniref:dihydrolipoyllysine-residue acetyltransferase component 2 of pyruvate dehydrogenase complex, mitochondrial isoform X2 n=1 Tax=Brassica napus TaxID=3708 RepID=UPI000BBEAAEE|nr:dihydrolipoyllysine-residue acetyltransferase component 2 of pyruvate dehydrogenase complex, mitochondrial isoform X2 [Brassica napus]
MAYASRIIIHSNKLKHVSTLLRREHSVAARGFSNSSTHPSLTARDLFSVFASSDMLKTRPPVERISKCRATTVPMPSGISTMSTKPMSGPSFFREYISSSQMRSVRGFSSGSDLPPHQEIGMPSLSPTMTEGNIARWLKKEGDKVAPGEVLCEVETDKATVEMECMEEGYLAKILKEEGAKAIQVGEVIAITVEEEEDIQKFKDYTPSSGASPAAPEAKSAPSPPKEEKVEKPASAPEAKTSKPSSAPSEDRIFASPLAKKLAEDNNVPLSSIKATGPEGRIVKADVEEFLASRGKETTAKPSKPTDSKVPALDYVDIPHTQIRKVTASRLAFSKQTIPHYYLTVDTCVDKMMGLRSQLNSFQETNGGKRISVNDLVIKAAALALRKVPQCNSSWTDEYIRQFSNVNINVAVQTENGLYVPVVKDADKKGLSTIGEEVRFLAQKAKENSLKPEDYEGGTFTVSNLGGPFGIKQFCAVINPPQAAILAIGSAEKRVVAGGGPDQFNVASYMSVTLSCDHRVIDGAIGAEWLKAFKGYIETPESMLL